MPTIGSETSRSSELPEATKETKISESAVAPDVIHGEDWPVKPEPPPEKAPVVASLEPEFLNVPGEDAVLRVFGTGFIPGSVVVWNGGDEPTGFVSETELSTIVKPSTVHPDIQLPFSLPVAVRNGELLSNELTFTFEALPEEEVHLDKAIGD